MDSSAEQTFMRTGRNSGWRPVRLRPVRVSFRCPSGARPLALALGWWWLGFTWAEHAARTPHPRFGDRLQAHARRRASHGVLLALERSSRASLRAALRRHDRPISRSICFGDAGPEPAELRASAASRGCYNPRRSAARPARVGRVDRAPPVLAGCGVVYHRPVRSARLAHDSW